ncbi:MAG: hypothetical protein ACYC2Y_07715 [Armatimonadota bacterium]
MKFLIATLLLMLAVCAQAQTDVSVDSLGAVDTCVRVYPATVGPEPVSFEVTNTTDFLQYFLIRGNGIEERSEWISPGAWTELTLDLPPGEYEVFLPTGPYPCISSTLIVTP